MTGLLKRKGLFRRSFRGFVSDGLVPLSLASGEAASTAGAMEQDGWPHGQGEEEEGGGPASYSLLRTHPQGPEDLPRLGLLQAAHPPTVPPRGPCLSHMDLGVAFKI